jgi:hypothetical protein
VLRKVRRLAIQLPGPLAARLKTAAKRQSRKELHRVSMSNVIAQALVAYLKKPRPRRKKRRVRATGTQEDGR